MKSKILNRLRGAEEFVSGQQLCEEFGVSRTAVWKAINQLKEEGYEIEAVHNKGYRLLGCPDIISAEEVKSRLHTDWAGCEVKYFDTLDSTNICAKRMAEEGAPNGTLVIADEQTAGRGRCGRAWETPKGTAIAMTLYTALVNVSKAAAPMIPFMTEDIYRNLVCSIDKTAPESVHLCDFPKADMAHVDKELEANMDEVLKIVVMGRACRNTANIKNRQPIENMFVKAPKELPEYFADIIRDELNSKKVTFTQDVKDFTSYSFKPQLKTVGPKYGKLLGGIKQALSALDGNQAMDELKDKGSLTLDINGSEVVLYETDLLIDTAQIEGYVSEQDNDITVVLDTNLTPELIEEGFVRELISKVQTMRKEAGFEVMDRIRLYAADNEKILTVLKDHMDEIKDEVLADEIVLGSIAGYEKEWSINGENVRMGVEKTQK